MQTFLPFADFEKSAKTLDRQRLGKQRVEAWQILKTLEGGGGWENHPVVAMWRSNPSTLIEYGLAMCLEWQARGYVDNMESRFRRLLDATPRDQIPPSWLGDRAFHRSHQSNLLRKDPEHYKQHFPKDLPNDLPYVWPGVPLKSKPAQKPRQTGPRNPNAKRRS